MNFEKERLRADQEKVDERKEEDKIARKVEAMADEMKEKGFDFRLKREGGDFVIKIKESQRKFSKHNPLKSKEVEEAIADLKTSGMPFEISEDEDVITLSFYREIHVPAWEKIPVGEGNEPIEKVIKAFIMNPGGSIYETINSPDL